MSSKKGRSKPGPDAAPDERDGYSVAVAPETVETLKNKPVTLGVVVLLGGLLFGCVTIVYQQLREVDKTLTDTRLDDEKRFGELNGKLLQLGSTLEAVRGQVEHPKAAPPAQAAPRQRIATGTAVP